MRVHRRASWRQTLLASILALFGLGFFMLGGILIAVAITPVPDTESFASRQLDQSTKIYDRTGEGRECVDIADGTAESASDIDDDTLETAVDIMEEASGKKNV